MDSYNKKPFSGLPDSMCLVTHLPDSSMYFITDDSIIEQLEIIRDGTVNLTEMNPDQSILSEDTFDIDPDTAGHILQKVCEFFSKPFSLQGNISEGDWELELTNTLGDKFYFKCGITDELSELSDFIRYWLSQEIDEEELLPYDELLCFDGLPEDDAVTGLSLNYRWSTEGDGQRPGFSMIESLVIDGDEETIRHVWQPMNGIRVTREYNISGAVSEFLDSIDCDIFYEPISGDPPNVASDLKDRSEYELSVSFKGSVPMYFKGSYDRNNLPPRWGEFIDKLLGFLRYYADTDIFDSSVYNSRKRCTDDLIFLSVEFEQDGPTYYYITDDDTIVPGDAVIVPVGIHWTEKEVRVVNKEYYSPDRPPIPLEKVKPVLRRASR